MKKNVLKYSALTLVFLFLTLVMYLPKSFSESSREVYKENHSNGNLFLELEIKNNNLDGFQKVFSKEGVVLHKGEMVQDRNLPPPLSMG